MVRLAAAHTFSSPHSLEESCTSQRASCCWTRVTRPASPGLASPARARGTCPGSPAHAQTQQHVALAILQFHQMLPKQDRSTQV